MEEEKVEEKEEEKRATRRRGGAGEGGEEEEKEEKRRKKRSRGRGGGGGQEEENEEKRKRRRRRGGMVRKITIRISSEFDLFDFHQRIMSHVCGTCGKQFSTLYNMQRHDKNVHKQEQQTFGHDSLVKVKEEMKSH